MDAPPQLPFQSPARLASFITKSPAPVHPGTKVCLGGSTIDGSINTQWGLTLTHERLMRLLVLLPRVVTVTTITATSSVA